ncbi:alpha-glucan family phosphorylase [Parvibaculum sedimenti]|uniref:Alpha-glucan family phosphorylase n=1 Tax=Parvibaculum sedimenti TaxID=2608632 RepID=A0A6N6VKA2_9HYPH|nr:alpha-glucan family phosphorylase [Parvibaculum sedimenti]KAB7739727.1 alpha-glucan family phosphorylase [Parvibaculum sedimenti]
MVALPLPTLPGEISILQSLTLDLRWTWSHEGDALWSCVNEDLWERTHNPWVVLQSTPAERFKALARDKKFLDELASFVAVRERYLKTPGWFRSSEQASQLGGVAYFSMEFGLGAALPLYAGGLGILAGDFLKAASDLDVPIVGIGLLYQEGYFRQVLDASGGQQEFYPFNEPAAMPIEPVILPEGGWLRIPLEMPGRVVLLRVWQANVGRVKLYLLDSNDALNGPPDRGITAKLYGGGTETRLMQEIVLGIGGWRVVKALHPEIEVCHINEGHAAFAIIERARQQALKENIDFWDGLWATRAGNVFTTHTPVAAGFDRFPADLLRKYLPYVEGSIAGDSLTLADILALGRINPDDEEEQFNMAYLALRGSATCVGVSRLHGEFSRRIFQPLFPRWPTCEVPVGHITNGVHMPTWDSAEADRIWTEACGKERWRSDPGTEVENIAQVPDEELWAMRNKNRAHLVHLTRRHLATQLRERGRDAEAVHTADTALDPNILMIGFSRRFTEYKRTDILLRDLDRLGRLLLNENRPAQIVMSGKAHPADSVGKEMIRSWINVARQPKFRQRVVFLEDYDIDLAQHLVQGVDVWINTPRRPWEACGTSGMKILVNGGLNCSILDGWWDEAYRPDVGWAIGDARGGSVEDVDARDAESLYETLETRVIPEFYDCDVAGVPRAWLQRIRNSMSILTPAFAGSRMMKDYIEQAYLPRAQAVAERLKDKNAKAREMNKWSRDLHAGWSSLHIGRPTITRNEATWNVVVPVHLGEVAPSSVRVELFADARDELVPEIVLLHREHEIPGSINGFVYAGAVSTSRSIDDYTARIVPDHPDVVLPNELPLIAWQR